MTYNIHPLFVHFPIALLFSYSIIKILPLRRWFPKVAWRDIERIFLFIGVLGAFGALLTGDTAEHLVHPQRNLVDAHSTFGAIATWIYGALLLGEISAMINTRNTSVGKNWGFISSLLRFFDKVFCNGIVSGILAVFGLVAITITGMLGGVIAYGLTADPIAPYVLKILGITLIK